jgi:hypothetical protein
MYYERMIIEKLKQFDREADRLANIHTYAPRALSHTDADTKRTP